MYASAHAHPAGFGVQRDHRAALEDPGGVLRPGDDGLIHGQTRDGGVGVLAVLLGDDARGPAQVVHNAVVRLGDHQDVPIPEALGDVLQMLAHAQPGGDGFLRDPLAGEEHMAHHVDLHHIGGAGNPQGHPGGDDNNISAADHIRLLGRVHGMVEESVGVAFLGDEQRNHAPGQVQLAAHVLLCGAAYDGIQGPEFRELPGGDAGFGHGDDGPGIQVVGGGTGGVRDGVGHVKGHVAVVPGVEPADIVDALLGLFRDAHHGFQGLHRVLARRGLPGEHDAAGAVVDGVGHICGLGPGGTGVFHHGIQHLGGGNHLLARQIGFLDQLLLQHRNVLKGDLHAHISSGDHDAVSNPKDFVDVLDALHILDFGNDVHGMAFVFFQNLADLQDVGGRTGEGGGDEIEAVLNAEDDIGAVPFADKGHREPGAGYIDALAVGDFSPVDHGADNVRVREAVHLQFHQAVVNKHPSPHLKVAGQPHIGDGSDLLVAGHISGSKSKGVSRLELNRTAGEGSGADLRAFGVQDGGNGQAQFFPQAGDNLQLVQGVLVVQMGEIEPGSIHAAKHQAAEYIFILRGRAQCADDLGLSCHDGALLSVG